MESEFSGIFRVKLVAKNIVRGSPGTQFMHMRVKVLCHSCRTTTFQNISQKLFLKQTRENYETYLTHFQLIFYLNPLIPNEKIRKLKVFRYFLGA